MKGQFNLFADLPPPSDKPLRFAPAERPIWTESKSQLIERYLFYFVMITKHGAYIDGFAGPQYPDKSDAWAAKLVLESKPPFMRNFWLCELDTRSIELLKDLKASQAKNRQRTIDIVPGDFNANVSSVLQRSGITENTASFCLLDQRTFECHWSTVEAVARFKAVNKIEIFYFLASGWLDRSIGGTTKNHEIIEKWWGRPDWRQLKGMQSRSRVDLLTGRFKNELGYKHVYAWPIYSREKGGRVLYHMVHATDHDEAPKLMNRAYRNATKGREDLKTLQRDLAEIWEAKG